MTNRSVRSLLTIFLASPGLLTVAFSAAEAAQGGGAPHRIDYGNITIDGYQQLHTNTRGTGESTLIGPGMVIATRDKAEPTQFRLTAVDQVVGHLVGQGKKRAAVVALTGHLHYTIRQRTAHGERTITGTAGHADYDGVAEQVRLTEGVNATLTDASDLSGPATLRGSSLTVPAPRASQEAEPYSLAGDPETNDIALTLRGSQTAAGRRGFAGPVHLYHFRTALLEMGHMARAGGPDTTADFTDTGNNTQGQVKSASIELDFDRRLRRARSHGGTQFQLQQPDKKGVMRSVAGHSDAFSYESADQQAELTGDVVATVVDPGALLEPAHLEASRVVARQLPAAAGAASQKAAYRFEITGAPGHALIKFRLRPAQKAVTKPQPTGAKPQALPFAIDDVQVTDFTTAVYEPGKTADFTGESVVFLNTDQETHSSTRLQGGHLTAAFAEDGTLARATAAGRVRYRIEQPSGTQKGLQIVQGTAAEAVFTNVQKTQQITAQGPLTVSYTTPGDPDANELVGTAQDKLTYNLTTGALDMSSPDRLSTATVVVHDSDKSTKPKQP